MYRPVCRAFAVAALSLLTVSPSAAQEPAAPAAARSATRKPLPLEATRTLSLTTSKGSWMSVDVSPDGQTIVFDMLGDLYTLPIAGGTATRISQGMAFDHMPTWSPDGKRIAFISDRNGAKNLWLMSADGRDSTQLSRTTDDMYASPGVDARRQVYGRHALGDWRTKAVPLSRGRRRGCATHSRTSRPVDDRRNVHT